MSIETIIANLRDEANSLRESCLHVSDPDAVATMQSAATYRDSIADQLSACRTAEAVAWQTRYALRGSDPVFWSDWRQAESQEAANEFLEQNIRHGISCEIRPVFAHPAKAVPEGEHMAEVYVTADQDSKAFLTRTGRELPTGTKLYAHPAPVASRVTRDARFYRDALDSLLRGIRSTTHFPQDWDEMDYVQRAQAALTPSERKT